MSRSLSINSIRRFFSPFFPATATISYSLKKSTVHVFLESGFTIRNAHVHNSTKDFRQIPETIPGYSAWQWMIEVIKKGTDQETITAIFKKAFRNCNQGELNMMVQEAMHQTSFDSVASFCDKLNVRKNLEEAGILLSISNGIIEMDKTVSIENRSQLIHSVLTDFVPKSLQ
jgi:hypothetical protein